jgi:PAS domain S-box-containing protein
MQSPTNCSSIFLSSNRQDEYDRMTDLSKEQIARLRGLNAVYQALNAVQLSAFSLPLLLQIVLETGAKLTGAKYGALGIFDESGAKLADFLTIGLDEETKKRIGSQPMGLGLLGVMSDEPGAIRLRDLTRHPKSVGFPPHHPPMKSFLGISIRAHGRLFGRLYLTEKQGAEEFSEIDAELITALASQAGIILERELLIEQLKAAEARHRLILESAAEGIYGLDLEGICTFINKAGAAMLGYRPEELVGRRMHSLVHHTRPNGSPYPEEECPTERSRRHGRPAHLIEDSYWRKDGTTFPVQLSCAPLVSDGALRGAVVTFFDITARKEAERRNALDHGIARAVIESATVDEANRKILRTVCEVLGWEWSAVWQVDQQANVLRCMTAWHRPDIAVPEFETATCRMTFAPGVGLPGRVWSHGVPEYIPDVARDPNFPRAAVAARSGLRSGFAFPIRLGGDIVGVMEFFSRESRKPSRDVLDLLNTLGGQIGLQIERKKAASRLMESENQLRTIIDTNPECVKIVDETGALVTMNPRGLALVEADSLEEVIGKPVVSLVAPEYRDAFEQVNRRACRGESGTLEFELIGLKGTRRWLDTHVVPFRTTPDKAAMALSVTRDITARKRAEEALRDAQARLLQAQEEERKRIAREIHDELGQQLTMLRFGLVKLAQAEPQPPAYLRTQASALTQPVDAMIETVRRIATTLRPAILDDLGLAAALEWLVTDFRAKTHIPCDVSLTPAPEGLDDTRSLALFRILQEALTNVARHAQAARVTIRLQQAGGFLVLEIKDNGRGLTEAQRVRPTGVGLFGMQERALGVGGTVTIQSRPNEGTTVTARIPLRNRQ